LTDPLARGGQQRIPRPDDWRLGGPPAWSALTDDDVADLNQLVERLEAYIPSEIVRGPAVNRPALPGKKSAVLVALYPGDRGATVLLTKRALHMRSHAGEIAFPGGSVDPGDKSLWHTAVREAHEEIGLVPSLVRQVGQLDRFVTGASFSLVQPLVARLDSRPDLVASPDEVAEIIETPLAELLEPGVYRQEAWYWDDRWVPMHFFELVGETVWGATALMLHNLLAALVSSA